MKNKINEEFNKTYSFSPKINKNYNSTAIFTKAYKEKNEAENTKTIPAYIRLYEESKLRNQKYLEKKKEIEDNINNLSCTIYKKISLLNLKKINELYENKKKIVIDEKTKNKVQNEEGITFKPYIYKNKFAKNIFSNFFERNSRFLEDKEKFINSYQSLSNTKKKISNNDKKEIVKNIIDRLYNESKSGTMNNSFVCNKYIKNMNNIENKFNNQNYNSVD